MVLQEPQIVFGARARVQRTAQRAQRAPSSHFVYPTLVGSQLASERDRSLVGRISLPRTSPRRVAHRPDDGKGTVEDSYHSHEHCHCINHAVFYM